MRGKVLGFELLHLQAKSYGAFRGGGGLGGVQGRGRGGGEKGALRSSYLLQGVAGDQTSLLPAAQFQVAVTILTLTHTDLREREREGERGG